MHCLPCTAQRIAPQQQEPVVGLCSSCQGALCLTHWNQQQQATGPGGMRLTCGHSGQVPGTARTTPRPTAA